MRFWTIPATLSILAAGLVWASPTMAAAVGDHWRDGAARIAASKTDSKTETKTGERKHERATGTRSTERQHRESKDKKHSNGSKHEKGHSTK